MYVDAGYALSSAIVGVALIAGIGPVAAAPASVTIFGDLQSELGCAGDFVATCALTSLVFDASDGVWQRAFNLPAGSFQALAALNGDVGQLIGRNASAGGGSPIVLSLGAPTAVKFYFDAESNWLVDGFNTPIVTMAGSFQSELGCAGDFQPDCLRSWLKDVDGDGIFALQLTGIPGGAYTTIVTHGESFDERYGAGGVAGGANIDFSIGSAATQTTFLYDSRTHILTIRSTDDPLPVDVAEPTTLAMVGLGLIALRATRRRGAA